MPSFNRSKFNAALLFLPLMFCLVGFQNCQKVQFDTAAASQPAAQNEVPATTTSSSVPVTIAPAVAPVLIPPADITMMTCASFRVLAANNDGTYSVPARDTSATCYAIHVMNTIPSSNSALTTNYDNAVLALNQGVPGQNYPAGHPYMMAHSNVIFSMAGARRLNLSGALDQTTSILVDNFLMVGFGASSATLDASNYAAYGTADSSPDANSEVFFNNKSVPLTVFSTGGTASIGNVDISQTVAAATHYQLDLRADDCGGVRALSDIYLIFQ